MARIANPKLELLDTADINEAAVAETDAVEATFTAPAGQGLGLRSPGLPRYQARR